jgi:hypothetical protein
MQNKELLGYFRKKQALRGKNSQFLSIMFWKQSGIIDLLFL